LLRGDPRDLPYEWLVSRVCESFSCTPPVAEELLETDPEMVLDILQLRAYAETKQALDRAQDEKQAPKGEMADLVMAIEYELMQARGQE
jgi:hypothetical protein